MTDRDSCYKCGDALYGGIEFDTGLCGHCADRMYENEQATREWYHYHDEPMPASELPHPRKAASPIPADNGRSE